MLAPAPAAAPSGADPELGIRSGQKRSEASVRKHRGPQAELNRTEPHRPNPISGYCLHLNLNHITERHPGPSHHGCSEDH